MSIERRRFPRETVNRQCWLSMVGTELIDAHVHNISEGGAMISTRSAIPMPDHLDLFMTRDRKVGRRCRVVWRTEREIGLEFMARTIPAPFDADAAAEIVKI